MYQKTVDNRILENMYRCNSLLFREHCYVYGLMQSHWTLKSSRLSQKKKNVQKPVRWAIDNAQLDISD